MGVSHVLDLLAHPLLTYYFWCRHMKHYQNQLQQSNQEICITKVIRQVLTADVIIAAYLYSRIWSLTHTKYNTGQFGLWYMGFDVYIMDSLDSWYPAYIVEGIVYTTVTFWKVYDSIVFSYNKTAIDAKQEGISNATTSIPTASQFGCDTFEKKPSLLWSESTISIDSRASQKNR
jgi:hypothetical protein